MNKMIIDMILKNSPKSWEDYDLAVRETIQKICLLGLWRAKFFEKAAFYGGTALRLFYGLPRFSEDLDFSLLHTNMDFSLPDYHMAVKKELESYGFEMEITGKQSGAVESAFIKTDTSIVLLDILAPENIRDSIGHGRKWKVKFEVDKDPPGGFKSEIRYLLEPSPISVRLYSPSSIFSGKMHAVLFRGWKNRVKGRDWYDMVFLIGQSIAVSLMHLKERLVQTGHWKNNEPFGRNNLLQMLKERIDQVDFESAKNDVLPFIKDPDSVNVWSKEFHGSGIDD